MKRLYSDLHLRPDLRDFEHTASMLRKAVDLGYRLIAVTLPPNRNNETGRRIREACDRDGIDFATRVDLRPSTPNDLLHDLRKLRRSFEIVCVLCQSKNVSRQAAKDRRVDLLNFPLIDFRQRFFDLAEAELASNSLASLEIDIEPILTSDPQTRIRLLSSLRKETSIAENSQVPIVVSGGASNERFMRRPVEMAVAASLFGLEKQVALDAVSKNPSTIVKRNREKLSSRFVAPGIRVLRRGKDC
jgi:RNase P/RNase MRP subunit p30